MQLDVRRRQEIFDNGFTVLRGAVSPLLVNEAVRAINASLGSTGMHPDELPTLRAQSYCPEITGSAAITDLFNASPLASLCESALGEGNALPIRSGQIALRFPMAAQSKPFRLHPHLDGVSTSTNGVAPGTIGNFTALVAVLLSDLPETFSGNFTVWPGTHRQYEEYFRKHGVDAFQKGAPPIDLPEPVQITGRAGDAVFCHYQIGHGIAPNLSPHIRYAVFFRVVHSDHASHRAEVLSDIWRDWSGINATIVD